MSIIGFQILFIALLGWICGILVNYLSDILPVKPWLAAPICLHCQAPQSPGNYFFWPRSGDVLLGAVIGLMVGFPEIIQSLTLTIIAAGVFSLGYLLVMLLTRRYRLGTAFPYGPFILLGAMYFLYFIT